MVVGERLRARKRVNNHPQLAAGKRMPPDMRPPDEWLDWGAKVYGVDRARIGAAFVRFRDYWADVPGERGLRVDWFPTFKNRLHDLREKGKL